ncbi:hypothetical protein ACPOL_7148 (plasmid) [Acidisarcina polymorpha]|uniref:Uncharacterized protein n=1 Tax=Acidisarcina polymorpha TaxID=2211140 RepID=A0A2Z5GBL4_9BACT|nr:hypothetical protein ACPOL_7140 [Acidisarcina polymorpha]AXC16340.1 hypothetical protein ACPOL_7148 [Acidisarcina polymorpha]
MASTFDGATASFVGRFRLNDESDFLHGLKHPVRVVFEATLRSTI